ncbi:MAG: peptidase M20 [Pirellulaceae bacterium]|nr:MAG: peptidase M20 [Pirellulaceae bacterium]
MQLKNRSSKIDPNTAIALVMQLMAIAGKSGEEAQVASFVEDYVSTWAIEGVSVAYDTAHRRSPIAGQVGNLVIKIPGNSRLPRLMLSAHLDTVPICVGCRPVRRGGEIVAASPSTGLGADDRAGVAAVLVAARAAVEHIAPGSRPPLTLCFFVQEEVGLHGARYVSVGKLGKPAWALNFDGGDPQKLTIGATGGERMRVVLRGIAAHAGLAPEQGASAIEAAALAIADLRRRGWLGRIKKGKSTGTSNIGVLRGGTATNVVADEVEIAAEARSHESEFRERIATTIADAFHQAAARVMNEAGQAVSCEVQRRVDYESFRLAADDPVVRHVATAIEEVGGTPHLAVSGGGVDANWINRHGIPTVTIGCGQRNVHTTDERLDIADYLLACEVGYHAIARAGTQVG